MYYLNLLRHSFAVESESGECPPESRLAYLSRNVFDFTTYDSEMDELFAAKAVEACVAISNGTTHEYISDAENYKWYLLMCNMPFFAERLEWGTSIRGAWWGGQSGNLIGFQSCGLWDGDRQLSEPMPFSTNEWLKFIGAVIEFASVG